MSYSRRLIRSLVCLVSALVALNVGAQDALGPTLSKISKQGKVYLGYREAMPPFTFALPGGEQPIGYVWDVCRHVVKALELKLEKSVDVVPVVVSDNARTMLIKNHVVDLDCGGAANTVARQKQVTLSVTLYVSDIKVLVRSDSGLTTISELAGKRAVTVSGGSERQLKRMALEKGVVMQHQLAYSPREAMALLREGKTDAFVAEDAMLSMMRAAHPDFRLLDAVLATEPIALMLPLDDLPFKQFVDGVLVSLMKSGELTRIYDKWFMAPIPPESISLDLPMSPALKSVIQIPSDTPVN